MKKLFFLLLFVLSLISCTSKLGLVDTSSDECDYSQCNSQEPGRVNLEVKFTRSAVQRSPKIFLLLGRFEEQNYLDTISTDTVPAYRDYVLIPVDVDHYYSVVAEYFRGDDTIYALDGSYVFKTFYYLCDSICWQVKGNSLNIKLKN